MNDVAFVGNAHGDASVGAHGPLGNGAKEAGVADTPVLDGDRDSVHQLTLFG